MLYSTGTTLNSFYSDNYNSSVTGNTVSMTLKNVDLFIYSANTTSIFTNARYGIYRVNLSGLTTNAIYTYSLSYSNSGGTFMIETGMLNHNQVSFSANTSAMSGYTRAVNETKFYTR